MRILFAIGLIFSAIGFADDAPQNKESVAGLYKALLQHEGTKYVQYANITVRTVNDGTTTKVSANIRSFLGEPSSLEFLTYEYDNCETNPFQRKIIFRDPKNDISMVVTYKADTLAGEWWSSTQKRKGKITASKVDYPQPPKDAVVIKSLTGHYRGNIKYTHDEFDKETPQPVAMTIVTTQDSIEGGNPVLKISGVLRVYLGPMGSDEFDDFEFSDVRFNLYTRYFTAKIAKYSITLKGILSEDGVFQAPFLRGGWGEVGKIELKRYP